MHDGRMGEIPMWVMMALLSALFAGATAILSKMGVRDTDSTVATAIRTTLVLAFAWLLVFAQGLQAQLWQLSARTYLFLALSGLCTGASWLCYFQAVYKRQLWNCPSAWESRPRSSWLCSPCARKMRRCRWIRPWARRGIPSCPTCWAAPVSYTHLGYLLFVLAKGLPLAVLSFDEPARAFPSDAGGLIQPISGNSSRKRHLFG